MKFRYYSLTNEEDNSLSSGPALEVAGPSQIECPFKVWGLGVMFTINNTKYILEYEGPLPAQGPIQSN